MPQLPVSVSLLSGQSLPPSGRTWEQPSPFLPFLPEHSFTHPSWSSWWDTNGDLEEATWNWLRKAVLGGLRRRDPPRCPGSCGGLLTPAVCCLGPGGALPAVPHGRCSNCCRITAWRGTARMFATSPRGMRPRACHAQPPVDDTLGVAHSADVRVYTGTRVRHRGVLRSACCWEKPAVLCLVTPPLHPSCALPGHLSLPLHPSACSPLPLHPSCTRGSTFCSVWQS